MSSVCLEAHRPHGCPDSNIVACVKGRRLVDCGGTIIEAKKQTTLPHVMPLDLAILPRMPPGLLGELVVGVYSIRRGCPRRVTAGPGVGLGGQLADVLNVGLSGGWSLPQERP